MQTAPSSDGSRATAARVSVGTPLLQAAAKRPESLPRRLAEAEDRSVRHAKRASSSNTSTGSNGARRVVATTEHHGSESMQTSESLQMAPSSGGSRAAAARESVIAPLLHADTKRSESLP